MFKLPSEFLFRRVFNFHVFVDDSRNKETKWYVGNKYTMADERKREEGTIGRCVCRERKIDRKMDKK